MFDHQVGTICSQSIQTLKRFEATVWLAQHTMTTTIVWQLRTLRFDQLWWLIKVLLPKLKVIRLHQHGNITGTTFRDLNASNRIFFLSVQTLEELSWPSHPQYGNPEGSHCIC